MKRIFQFSHCTLHLYRKKIILFSVLSIGSSLIPLFNTLLSGRFIDFLASPNCVEWKPQLCYYCILFLATIMISFAISFALGRIREKLHTMVSYNINRQMLVHIQQIPFSKTFFWTVHALLSNFKLIPMKSLHIASMPAKATRAFLFLKRLTSPISAIRAGPVMGPVPSICMTTSYSGSSEANRFISS